MYTALLLVTTLLAATAPQPVIKSIGILGPIPGSQDTAGQVEIESGRALAGQTINLQSSNPGVAQVPLTATLVQGTATFAVKTFPVKTPTDVTITAQIGSSSKSAILRVLPPKLSVLGCDIPPNVSPYKPLKCTAWLDGLAPEATAVTLWSSLPVAIVPASVTIARGTNKEPFQVKAQPIAQSASAQISATYAGVTKSAAVTILPVALESFTISPTTVVGGNYVDLMLKLTAPPPQSGLVIKFSAYYPPWGCTNCPWLPSQLPMKDEQGKASMKTYGVDAPLSLTITASSDFSAGDTRQATVHVVPATLQSISINPDHFSNVPLGGQKATATVYFNGMPSPPNTEALVDIQYGGDTQITGPARVDAYQGQQNFTVTVSPCSVQSTCTVFIKARYRGVEKQVSAKVTP